MCSVEGKMYGKYKYSFLYDSEKLAPCEYKNTSKYLHPRFPYVTVK
jgi:hypothetical protein